MNALLKSALLVFFFTLCASAAFVTHRLHQRTPPPAPRDLYSVVNQQIAAFRSHDFPSAYQYAASGVQQKFTVAQFEAMIRRDYPELGEADRIEFGSVEVRGASAIVQVHFLGTNQSARTFLYSLIAESGTWKVDGAEELHRGPYRRLRGLHA